MSSSSLFLTPSSTRPRAVAPVQLSSSSALSDVVPFEAALQRLLYEKVHSDEQLSSYGVQQAYRGLLYAVRAGTLQLKSAAGPTSGLLASPSSFSSAVTPSDAAVSFTTERNTGVAPTPRAQVAAAERETSCAVRGWQAVLYRLALAAVRSADDLDCAVFLSVRLLCDPASAHGEGNERPCCTEEWTRALLRGLPLDEASAAALSEGNSPDAHFARLAQTSHRYQLGYLLLLSNTLRMLASGRVDGQHLCSHYPALFHGVASTVLPLVARCVETSLRDSAETAPAPAGDSRAFSPPSRMSVELNNLVLHAGYWLSMDVLMAHTDADDADVHSGKTKKRPLVLDRDQPAQLWGCVTLVRNALCRALRWLQHEAVHFTVERAEKENRIDPESSKMNSSISKATPSTALLVEVSQQLTGVFTDLLKRHEYLQNAHLNATRAYTGVATRDAQALTEMSWAHTLQMCFLLRNLTGSWVSVHGGLGYHVLCTDQLLPTNRDVLMFLASALLRIPTLETTKSEEDRQTFLATDAALSALLAIVAAAPAASMQTALWSSDGAVTQQIHALLVQRALRFHDTRVLKLSSLLSRAVLDAAVQDGALAGFATDSADQLLELLESDDDAASRCVGELLSVAILQHPYRLVPALFRLLQHGSAATRRHVLQVLSSLPDLISYSAASSEKVDDEVENTMSAVMTRGNKEGLDAVNEMNTKGGVSRNRGDDRRREVLRLLAENLLLQLQDEELCVRMLSSSLFAKIYPSDVMLPLLNLCVQRDTSGRKQSAALAALTSVLAAHTDNAATFLLLLHSAYECHCDARGRSAVSVAADAATGGSASDVAQNAEKSVQPPHASSPVKRPVPQTPGDILSQALLYSTAGPVDADVLGENNEDIKEVESGGANASLTGATESGSHRRKEGHLNSALLQLTDKWVHAALPGWTYEKHSLPIVRCLAQQARLHSSASADTRASADGVAEAEEDRVQFYMRYTLRLTATVTAATPSSTATEASVASTAAASSSTSPLSPAELEVVRARHLLAVWSVFFAERESHTPTSGETVGVGTWPAVVRSSQETLRKAAQGSAQARARVHAAVLPLLCLRSCAPGTLASAPLALPSRESPWLTDEQLLYRESNVDLMATSLRGGNGPVAMAGACAQVVSSIWQALWHAVSHVDATAAFFTVYHEIQRVLLEVLCRFPAAVFFAHWQRWKCAVCAGAEADADTDANDSEGSLTTRHEKLEASESTLFVYRVYMYGLSAYLAADLANGVAATLEYADKDPSEIVSSDVTVALQHRQTLLHVLTTVVPQWLMEDGESGATAGKAPGAGLEAVKQRLCMAAVDAGGVLAVAGLVYSQQHQQRHQANSPAGSVEAALVCTELASTCEELLTAPLLNLTLAYRATEPEKRSVAEATGAEGKSTAATEPAWAELLTRFQLCLRIHASMLRAIVAHPRGATRLLLLWFRHYLRSFVEVSNAACRSDTGRSAHGCRAAVDACGAVFQAVLMARKLDDAALLPLQTAGLTTESASKRKEPTTTTTTTPSNQAPSRTDGTPLLCRLAWEEKEALVSFSVGCTRFAASPAVQTTGVRLLSALLVAAPEIFVEVSATSLSAQQQQPQQRPQQKWSGRGVETAASVTNSGGDALQSAAMALQSIALMHADRSTRVLAEEVLQMLEKAYTAADGASSSY